MLFYPWGDLWKSQDSSGYNFANLPFRDVTTSTDLTTLRVSSPNFGRWFSEYPAGESVVGSTTPGPGTCTRM
jgi:hypothetical protein